MCEREPETSQEDEEREEEPRPVVGRRFLVKRGGRVAEVTLATSRETR